MTYRYYAARNRLLSAKNAAVGDPIDVSGPVGVEGELTGDGRRWEAGAIRWPDNPVSVIWDREDGDHTGMIVGTLTEFERRDDQVWGSGTLSESDDTATREAVARVAELIDEGAIGWSVALDEVTVRWEADATRMEDEEEWRHDDEVEVVVDARIRHVALVDTPAFESARPLLPGASMAAVATDSRLRAEAFDWTPGKDWQPIAIDGDHIYGHGAGGDCHRGDLSRCRKYDGDYDSEMRQFHTGAMVTLDDGTEIRPGPVTFAGLHSDAAVVSGPDDMRRHHEDGSTVVALVRAFDDDRGRLAFTGQLVDGLDATTRDQILGCSVSYERWGRPGRETLVGMHLVPTPGHPVAASIEAGYVAVDCGCTDGCDCD